MNVMPNRSALMKKKIRWKCLIASSTVFAHLLHTPRQPPVLLHSFFASALLAMNSLMEKPPASLNSSSQKWNNLEVGDGELVAKHILACEEDLEPLFPRLIVCLVRCLLIVACRHPESSVHNWNMELVDVTREVLHGPIDLGTCLNVCNRIVLWLVLHGQVAKNGVAFAHIQLTILSGWNMMEWIDCQELWCHVSTLQNIALLECTCARIHGHKHWAKR